MSTADVPDHRTPWREPASMLQLRWGAYRPRLLVAIALLVVGTGCILVTTTYSLPFLLAGSILQPTAWAVIPSRIGRRVACVLPVLGFTWLMLGGAGFAWCYAVMLAAWLLVRMRPLPSYSVLVLPIVASVVLGQTIHTYEQGWVTILVSSTTIVCAAWLARWIAVAVDSWQAVRTLRKRTDTLV